MLAAYNTVPGTMQRRTPQRSIIHPISGQLSAPIVECAVSAIENVPRPIPSSAVIGFRKTPKEKTLIGPAPTISANTVAATTHQRFAKTPPMRSPPRFVTRSLLMGRRRRNASARRELSLASIPAKAGTHSSASRTTEGWAPACAGVVLKENFPLSWLWQEQREEFNESHGP